MGLLAQVRAAWRNLVHRDRVERDLDDEITSTRDLLAAEHADRGLNRQAALRAASMELGGIEQVKESVREGRSGFTLDSVGRDVRYAVRGLVRDPLFSLVVIGTVALGVGANTSLFSAIQSVLLRPLPYADADRLVMIWEDATAVGFPRNTPAPGNYHDWRTLSRSFSDMAATRGSVATLSADGPPEQVLGRNVTANFFTVLGAKPFLGRTFAAGDTTSGQPVTVISYRLWQSRYAGDPSLIGRPIVLNGATELKATVIGVMPADFVFRTRDIDFWTPFDFTPAEAANRTSHFLTVVARLAPGVSLDQARDEMTAIAARQARTYPDSNDGLGIAVVPVVEEFLGAARLQVIVLACAALCVLLIACANLANLVLSRSIARRAELRMRAALGASRARLVQQMLVEGVVLSVIGGLVGLAAAPIGAAAIERLVPTTVAAPPSEVTTGLLLFAAGLSMLTGIAFSLLPAVYAARHSAAGVAGRSSRVTSDARSRMAREALVVVQVAVALVLLVGAGLLLRTLANLRAIDVGFRTDHLLTMRTTLPRTKYQDPSRRLEFYERVIDGVRQTAGVQNAAYASTLPFVSRGNTNGYLVDSELSSEGTVQGQAALVNKNDALYRVATANYLQTLGVRLVEGRLFEPSDGADSPKVVIVNETFARRHWPTGSALGHRVSFGDETGPWRTIVGVVRDVRESGYLPMMKPGAYLPYAQVLDTWALPEYLIARTTVAPETVASSLRSIVSRVDSDQAMTSVRTMEEIIDVDVADREQQATLIAAFSLGAIVLAALGLYGVLAHLVTQRRREIGVRMALGATRASIVLSVVRHGLLLSLAGLVAGLALSALLARLLTTLLYQVGQNDLVTHIGVVTILAAVAFFASAIPALRASSVDPMQVLRQE